jgi:hypothetical protein
MPPAARRRLAERLSELYGAGAAGLARLDLVVGGLSEPPLAGGLVGETFAAVLAEQFVRTRDGDRLWFENAAAEPTVAAALALGASSQPGARIALDGGVAAAAAEAVAALADRGGAARLVQRVAALGAEEVAALAGDALRVPREGAERRGG